MSGRNIQQQQPNYYQAIQEYSFEEKFNFQSLIISELGIGPGICQLVKINHCQNIMMVAYAEEKVAKDLKVFTFKKGNIVQTELFSQGLDVEFLNKSNRRIIMNQKEVYYDELDNHSNSWQRLQILVTLQSISTFKISENDESLFILDNLMLSRWNYSENSQLWIWVQQLQIKIDGISNFAKYFQPQLILIHSLSVGELLQVSFFQVCHKLTKINRTNYIQQKIVSNMFCLSDNLIAKEEQQDSWSLQLFNQQQKKLILIQRNQGQIDQIYYCKQQRFLYIIMPDNLKILYIWRINKKNYYYCAQTIKFKSEIFEIKIMKNGEMLMVIENNMVSYLRLK